MKDDFIAMLPLWVIGVFAHNAEAYASITHPDGERAVVVFTDEPGAQTYLERRCGDRPSTETRPLRDLLSVRDWLLQRKGEFSHIVYDHRGDGKRARFTTVAATLKNIEAEILRCKNPLDGITVVERPDSDSESA